MATLWTPDGERQLTDEDRARAESLAKEVAEVRERLAQTPASVVVANHVMGFYELATIHLARKPPAFTEATVAIDAMSAVLDRLRGRLGENEQVLRDALSQLQLMFVELKSREDEAAKQAANEGAGEGANEAVAAAEASAEPAADAEQPSGE
ncbi:MAG TPA: hypothetical protein VF183_02745 [Acidimicrobiales bacterium]